MNQMTAIKAWIGGKTYDPIEKTKELNATVSKVHLFSAVAKIV